MNALEADDQIWFPNLAKLLSDPDTLGKQVSSNLVASIEKRSMFMPFSWENLAPPREPTSKTWVDVDPEEVKAFKKWRKKYEALQSEGNKKGWLFYGYDGDDIEEPKGRWVYEYGD